MFQTSVLTHAKQGQAAPAPPAELAVRTDWPAVKGRCLKAVRCLWLLHWLVLLVLCLFALIPREEMTEIKAVRVCCMVSWRVRWARVTSCAELCTSNLQTPRTHQHLGVPFQPQLHNPADLVEVKCLCRITQPVFSHYVALYWVLRAIWHSPLPLPLWSQTRLRASLLYLSSTDCGYSNPQPIMLIFVSSSPFCDLGKTLNGETHFHLLGNCLHEKQHGEIFFFLKLSHIRIKSFCI